jgi:DNA modification methylase
MKSGMGDNVFLGELPCFDSWIKECYRVMRDGHLYIFTNTNSLQEILNSCTNAGFKLHNVISMIKDTGMPNRWYYKQTELVLFFRKGAAKPINDYTSRDNVKVIMPKASTGKLHITQKPLDFITKLVSNSTSEGDIVLDMFMGSGTTGIACINIGRNFIGIEKEKEYYDIAVKRIEDAGGNVIQQRL